MRVIIFFLLFIPLALAAEEHEHEHSRNEIGVSPGVLYSPSHRSWGFGVHAHFFHTLGEHSPWAIGGGLERVFTHGDHWTVNIGPKYQILEDLSLAIMPGVTFLKHDTDEHHDEAHAAEDMHGYKAKFSVHFELVYDLIHFKYFHLGPTLDYSWSSRDAHFMLGIHCAYIIPSGRRQKH